MSILNIFKLYAIFDGVITAGSFFDNLTMFCLLICSIADLTLIIERLVFFLKRRFDQNKFIRELAEYLKAGDVDGALAYCESKDTPLNNVIKVGIENIELPEDRILDLMESKVLFERDRMTRFLSGLSSVGAIGPLLGLFGTVDGLIDAFHQIAVTGTGGPEVVGKGISTALVTTWVGLIIAMLAIGFFNYFTKKTSDIVSKVEAAMREYLVILSAVRE